MIVYKEQCTDFDTFDFNKNSMAKNENLCKKDDVSKIFICLCFS